MSDPSKVALFPDLHAPALAVPSPPSAPFYVALSLIARRESWRKELFRPTTHIHRWWATRLGSVFRALVLEALLGERVTEGAFYGPHMFRDRVVLDPFMGSGTTLVEALKLGAKTVGVDINPVSKFIVDASLDPVPVEEVLEAFALVDRSVGQKVRSYYQTVDVSTGASAPVLYYFWVKQVRSPTGEPIPLFNKYIFSHHAYPHKNPRAQILCPSCWGVFEGNYFAEKARCPHCGHRFNPHTGPAPSRSSYVYDSTGARHKIIDLINPDSPPEHRLYALQILSGKVRRYQSIQDYDIDLYGAAKKELRRQRPALPLPDIKLLPGRNTNQAIKYGYTSWSDFFNDRQLLALGMLLREIMSISDASVRNQLLLVFSSTLEYNNMFASFKGEGTGAVRPIFSHHILKPERMPVENNVWGTPFNSGSFLTVFKRKYLRGKEYLRVPFDLQLSVGVKKNENNHIANKVLVAPSLTPRFANSWDELVSGVANKNILTLTRDSSQLESIPSSSIDAVVTDPPYFDFINYSELSDFFYSWLPKKPLGLPSSHTSRASGEVQNRDTNMYAKLLAGVFTEMHRVLKETGLLVFTFHHSAPEGWWAILVALRRSRFRATCTYPVYGEVSGSTTKSRVRHPIHIDAVLKARKIGTPSEEVTEVPEDRMLETAIASAEKQLAAFPSKQPNMFPISTGDRFVMRAAHLVLLITNSSLSEKRALQLLNTLHAITYK